MASYFASLRDRCFGQLGNGLLVFYLFRVVRVLNISVYIYIHIFKLEFLIYFSITEIQLNFNKKGNDFLVVVKQMMPYRKWP